MIADLGREVAASTRVHAGRDDAQLEAWLARLSPRLLAYAARHVRPEHDAADVVAQVLMTVWRRRDDLPAADDDATAWSFGVARNILANHRRGQVRREALADRLRDDLAAQAAQVAHSRVTHDGTGTDEQGERVRAALGLLAEADRELIALVVWDGLGIAEAGTVLGLAPSTARTRWARAKDRFAAALATLG